MVAEEKWPGDVGLNFAGTIWTSGNKLFLRFLLLVVIARGLYINLLVGQHSQGYMILNINICQHGRVGQHPILLKALYFFPTFSLLR